jgi:hypothetical protein
VSTRPLDTDEASWKLIEERFRTMTPAERVYRAATLTVLAHKFALAQIRHEHPEEDDRRHRLRLAARYLDRKTMRALGFQDDGSG